MWRLDERMAGAAHRIVPMLIAEKDEDVGLFCHVKGSGDAVAPRLAGAIAKTSIFQRSRIKTGDRHRHRTENGPALVHRLLPFLRGH